ncbi:hypothetical protein [Streptomyces badius]|uniref:Uncharacterized protein n=1 Tax=Streptomyces badius TaxID=1941 RepID=A0ABQ2TRJ1_STRBA|nr:hypothetical protein [Streptomyces badius]GGS83001.1 hypothetical protein GCM10010253_66980 [Streptomyces badius]
MHSCLATPSALAVGVDHPNPAEVELPDAPTVDKPIVTNWSTKRDEVTPRVVRRRDAQAGLWQAG